MRSHLKRESMNWNVHQSVNANSYDIALSHKIRGSVHGWEVLNPTSFVMLCCAVMETDLRKRGKFEGCDEDHMRFGNIEGREGKPCRMINFRSRSCYTLDLAPHRDDTRSMRFCAYYYVVTRSQPVGDEKRRYPRIWETKKKKKQKLEMRDVQFRVLQLANPLENAYVKK